MNARLLFRPLKLLLACSAALGLAPAWAQLRPDAGTLSEPQLRLPALPEAAGPLPSLPTRPAAAAAPAGTARITPAGFRFEGNTLFGADQLAALLADRVGRPGDLASLTEAAARVAAFYRERGYLLTEAYLPEQSFQAGGGTVTIAVIEARVGKVSVQLEGEQTGRISKTVAENIVAGQLRSGDPISAYLLDKPVLLLRDLAGYSASATVEPGASLGEADITVAVRAQGPRIDGSVSLDNHGARAAGQTRLGLNLNVNNPLGVGDLLALGGQQSDGPGSSLYRLAYSLPVGGAGTRIGVGAARLDYALGKQFAALGATGSADLLAVNVSHPLWRSRGANLQAMLGVERKDLLDDIAVPALRSEKSISSLRAGLAGQHEDKLFGSTAFNAYNLSVTSGRLRLEAADLALDQGVGGTRSAGSFSKINLDLQRTQFLTPAVSLHAGLQVQAASKNLSSAEKMSLGGITGVRAYPAGEAVGDSAYLVSLEYRHRLPPAVSLAGEAVSLLAFYDYGEVRFNRNGALLPGAANSAALSGAGIGASAGSPGNYLLSFVLAWRTSSDLPTTGDPDRAPRAWLSARKWF